jgi:ubiquinone/menaquinone biosynthesis C-methylase UbiE
MNATPNFDRLARPYRWLEFFSFGPCLALTRRTFIKNLADSHHALILGDGDGRFTARLLRINPTVQIDAIDASDAMLQALTRRAARNTARLHTHLADIRTWSPDPAAPYDLIATHFFLDCLSTDEVASLATRLRVVCAPSARWIVSDFAIPPNPFGHFIARPLVLLLYFAFACLTGLATRRLPDHTTALRQAGFTPIDRRTRLGGLLLAEMWQANPANSALSTVKPNL